jgi:hypothetical protein
MNREDPTRREFLQKIAKGAVYSAPLIATFAVAPDLLAQAGSAPGHHHTAAPAASTPSTPSEAPGPAPTDKHPPPSKKGG